MLVYHSRVEHVPLVQIERLFGGSEQRVQDSVVKELKHLIAFLVQGLLSLDPSLCPGVTRNASKSQ